MNRGCAAKVYGGGVIGGSPCSKKATVKDGNKWHCGTHSNAAKARRQAKADIRYEEFVARTNATIAQKREISRRANCYDIMLAALEAAWIVLVNRNSVTVDPEAKETLAVSAAQQVNAAIAAARGSEEGQDAEAVD